MVFSDHGGKDMHRRPRLLDNSGQMIDPASQTARGRTSTTLFKLNDREVRKSTDQFAACDGAGAGKGQDVLQGAVN